MENLKEEDVIVDVEYSALTDDEKKEVIDIQKKFIKSYTDNKYSMELDKWLTMELQENLPYKSNSEIKEMSKEILDTLKINSEKQSSLENAIENGRSKESWFASNLKQATSYMSMSETAKYLHELDNAVKNANESMYSTITNKNGAINQNFNLDGFIAEQHHANSFNLNSQFKGNGAIAEVLVPKPGETYGKNSVDIVIKDANGKIIERYQSKYGKTAEDTIKMINDGNYNNQRLLVPSEQVKEVQKAFPNKTVTDSIGSGDIKSNPLSKSQAKELQKEAQSSNYNDLNWNEYKSKDLAIGIGKQAGYAALQGAAIGAVVDIGTKMWNGEEIKAEEVVEQALLTGADLGIKAATAGALKVAAEKGVLKVIPKGTPAGIIANISYISIENVKILGKLAKGDLTVKEGLEKMEQTTVATIAGIAASAKGAAIGGAVGTVLGPVGAGVGAFIGGAIGYAAGSKVGETVVKVAQKVREKSRQVLKTVSNTFSSVGSSISNGVKIFASSLRFW